MNPQAYKGPLHVTLSPLESIFEGRWRISYGHDLESGFGLQRLSLLGSCDQTCCWRAFGAREVRAVGRRPRARES